MAEFGSIGSAHVEMRAKMDRLKTDFDGARKVSATAGARAGKAFNAGFLRGTTALKGAIAGLLTGAAFKSFLAGADKAINKLDEIAKTADSIGITTDALQELRVAADLSGTDVNVLSVGLRRLARAASDAQRGSLAQKEAFEALGVSVTKTNGELKDIDVLLLEISDGFTRMDNATRKAAIAQELLGRGGTQMVNLLNSGSDAIENMRRQARDLGIVIEEDLVREAVRLKDELTLLRKEMDSNLTRAMVRAGPLLVDLARALAEIATWAANAWEGLRLLAGFDAREPVLRLGEIRDELAELDEQAKIATETFQEFATGQDQPILRGAADAFASVERKDARQVTEEEYQKRLDETATKLDQIQKRREALLTERAQLFEVTGQAAPVIEGFARPEEDDGSFVDTSSQSDAAKEKIDERVRALQDMRQAILDANASLMAEREELGLEIEVLGKSNEVRDEAVAALENERAVREVLAFAQEQGLDLNSKEVQSLLALVEAQDQVRRGRDMDARQLAQNEAAIERAKSAQEEFTNALEGTADALVQVAFEGGSLKDVLLELLLTLVQMQSTQDALTGLFSGLFGGGGGGQGGIAGQIFQNAGLTGVTQRGGGGGGGGILGQLAQFAIGAVGSALGGFNLSGIAAGQGSTLDLSFPQNTGQLTGFAEGGFAERGTIAMVGEEGPEIGVFGSAARIFSNEDLRRVLSAPKESSQKMGPSTVNFNISTPDVGSFRRSQPQMAAEMQRILNSGNRQQ